MTRSPNQARKRAIPQADRRELAMRYGCTPGERTTARCHYCGAEGRIVWNRLHNGKPSGWVTFPGLEIDHVIPEHLGGDTRHGNLVLACRTCNRSKGYLHAAPKSRLAHDSISECARQDHE